MPTLMETTLKFDCTRLEEQVLLNKEKDVQLDTRVTALEGKETPVYTPTDLDLNTGIVAVTYDTTDGISLTTQGTIKANTGTNQVVVDYEIPIRAGDNITIDATADSKFVEVKLDKTQPLILEAPEFTKFLGVDFSAASGMPAGYLQMLISNYNQLRVVCPAGTALINFPVYDLGSSPSSTKSYTVLTDKTTKTLFGNQSLYGSGNIDLFRHHIVFTGEGHSSTLASKIYIDVVSSNSLKVDSLTDLKTLLGNTFEYGATGYDYHNGVVIMAINQTGYIGRLDDSLMQYTYPTGTWSDTVTTV